MKKTELIYKEILQQAIEENNRVLTQKSLATLLSISLSTVNSALKTLSAIGAVKINPRNFHAVSIKKILYHWATMRNLGKDIIYSTRADLPAAEIEKAMPGGAVFTAFSGYKFLFKDVPADYSEVYAYADEGELKEIKKRFPPNNAVPNLFVLKKDIKKITAAQLFVDLWNLKEWYAMEFLKALEEKINERVLE